MTITIVTTTCPFCSGGIPLVREPTEATDAELSRRLRGSRIQCEHPGCGKEFCLRRSDLRIRREQD